MKTNITPPVFSNLIPEQSNTWSKRERTDKCVIEEISTYIYRQVIKMKNIWLDYLNDGWLKAEGEATCSEFSNQDLWIVGTRSCCHTLVTLRESLDRIVCDQVTAEISHLIQGSIWILWETGVSAEALMLKLSVIYFLYLTEFVESLFFVCAVPLLCCISISRNNLFLDMAQAFILYLSSSFYIMVYAMLREKQQESVNTSQSANRHHMKGEGKQSVSILC